MRKLLLSIALFIVTLLSVAQQASQSPVNYANPLVGTSGIIAYGRTTPYVTPPFGMTQWTACTQNSRLAVPAYQYLKTRMLGFRGSHKPAMWMGDYGYVSLIPTVGKMKLSKLKKKSFFSHCNEKSKPYYYSIKMNTPNMRRVKPEITATSRCGVLKFTFPKHGQPDVLVEASQTTDYSREPALYTGHPFRKRPTLPPFNGWVYIDTAKQEIIGWNTDSHSWNLGPALPNFKGYFVIKFSEPFAAHGVWQNDTLKPDSIMQTADICGGWISFKNGTRTVQATVATSFISIEQARENLKNEIGDKKFEDIEQQTRYEWNDYLGRIELEGATKKQRGIFYSAMYHTLLFPRQFSEYGKYYSAFDDKIHTGVSYNDYSLWDTYRAEHPLLILIAPEHVGGMVQSLLQMYKEGGYMPKWPNPTYSSIMIGTHADAVVADAIVKNVKGIDLKLAYDACMKDAMVPPTGDSLKRWADRANWSGYEARAGLSWYKKLGYIPVDKTNESVANTLEGAYDDFCVAQVAKAAGNTADYDMLMKRSKNYVNLYNDSTGFMAPRNADGTWGNNPNAGFTEGSKWTYLFCVQHDVPGLINLMGGREQYLKKLNANFKGMHYVHENEPGHHYCYLFDYAKEAWRTQQLVAKYRRTKYRNMPYGMNGDDDCGQMSAWYVFSSLGFYPVTPGTDVYAIGTPLFPKATLYPNPEDRNIKFEIIAHHVSKRNIYVQKVTLNGEELTEPFLHHADIESGGQLIFEMGSKKRKGW